MSEESYSGTAVLGAFGESFGRYELRDRLGSGGFAEVYRAYDPELGREVALKVILAHIAADRDFVDRFVQEMRFAAGLSHPAIVPISDGTILSFLRGPHPMPVLSSKDWGDTWEAKTTPFPGISVGQKIAAMRLASGAIVLCSQDTKKTLVDGGTYAALSLGRSSKLVRERAQEKPIFMRYLIAASGEQIFPEGGGMLIRDDAGEVIGAVGVTGDTEDRDEELAAFGIRAAGLKTDEDCAAIGRRGGIRLTDA